MNHHVVELHNIMPIATIPSVLHRGILSLEQATKLYPHTFITPGPQIPHGLKLHQYAHLYFDAHNPTLFERKSASLCVLRVSPEIFDIEGIVLTDQEASSPYARYLGVNQIGDINFNKAKKCAGVLVPVCVPFCFILGAYVPDNNSLDLMEQHGFKRELAINPTLFFL